MGGCDVVGLGSSAGLDEDSHSNLLNADSVCLEAAGTLRRHYGREILLLSLAEDVDGDPWAVSDGIRAVDTQATTGW